MKMRFLIVSFLLSMLGQGFEFVKKRHSSNLYGHIDNKRISFEICLPDNIVTIRSWANIKDFDPVYFFSTNKAYYGIFTGEFDKLPKDVKRNLHELATEGSYSYCWAVDSSRRNLFLFKKNGLYTVYIHAYPRDATFSIENNNHLTTYMDMLSSIKIIDPKDVEAYNNYYLARSSHTAQELIKYLMLATKKHHDQALIDLLHLRFAISTEDEKRTIANQLKDFLILHMKSGNIDFDLDEIIFIYKYVKHEEMVSLLKTYKNIATIKANLFLSLYLTASKQWKQYSTDPWKKFSTEKINELLRKKKEPNPKTVTNANNSYSKSVHIKPQRDFVESDADPYPDLKTTTPRPMNTALTEDDPFKPIQSAPMHYNPSPVRENVYGPGIHQDVFGRPVQYHVPGWPSNEPTQHLNVTPNAYGPGIGMDQFGRPVTTRPAF